MGIDLIVIDIIISTSKMLTLIRVFVSVIAKFPFLGVERLIAG